jgi:hypothetical protein
MQPDQALPDRNADVGKAVYRLRHSVFPFVLKGEHAQNSQRSIKDD